MARSSTQRSQRSRDENLRLVSNRPRDEEGRFMSDDEDYRSSRSSRSGRSSRYEQDEDDDYESDNRRSRSSRGGRSSRSEGRGWFGDPEGHAEAAERGWEQGHRGQRGGRSSRDEEDDDDYRSSRSSRSSRGRGQGGWFGDPEGHAEAAERGWEQGHR
jgi:hypothetical protein